MGDSIVPDVASFRPTADDSSDKGRRRSACLALVTAMFLPVVLLGEDEGAPELRRRRVTVPWDLTAQLVVTGRPATGDAASLQFDVTAVGEGCELRLDGRRVCLLEVHAGVTTEVTSADLRLRPGEHRVLVKRRVHGVRVLVNRRQVLEYPRGAPAAATRVGSREAGRGVELRDVRVQPVGPVEFRDDFARLPGEAGPWRIQQGQWDIASQSLPGFSSNPFCLRGSGRPALALCGQWFWEDYRISAAVCLSEAADGAGLVVYVDRSGHYVILRGTRRRLTLSLVGPGQETVLAEHNGGLQEGQWHELALATRRNRVAAFVDTTPLFAVSVEGLEHGQAGLWAESSAGVLFDDVRAESCPVPAAIAFAARPPEIGGAFAADSHMAVWATVAGVVGGRPAIDDTLHQAPVGWRVAGGDWSLQSRWQCQPRWTWFGGQGRRLVAVWHKAQFEGDVGATAFAAFRMGSPFDPNYRHVGDLCVTVCGDGHDLASGYTFAFAADRNRVSRLYRLGEVVAETREGLLPDNRNSFPYREVHLPWMAVGLRRDGRQLTAEVDGKVLLTYEDADPLPGRHVALWSWDNDILLARARIEASAIAAPLPPAPGPADSARGVLRIDPGAALTRPGVPVPELSGLDLARLPRLRFRYRTAGPALCNLYLDVADRTHFVAFTAGHIRHDDIPLVARIAPSPSTDGRWHEVEVDLSALVAAYPEAASLPIRQAWFGLESDDPYRLCGFGGAAGRTAIDIAGVRLGRSGQPGTARRSPAAGATTGPEAGFRETFETGLGRVRAARDGAGPLLTLDPWDCAAGRRSLRIRNPFLGGACDVILADEPFSPARFPRLAFDYRVPDSLRVDLVLRVGPHWRTVKFTDADETWPVVGAISGVQADGLWHRAAVDVAELLHAAGLDGLPVTEVHLVSGGYPGNEEGVVFHLDNLELLPAGTAASGPADTRPPVVRSVTPAAGASAEGTGVSVTFADEGSGIDWASVRLTVTGRAFHVGHASVRYDPSGGVLSWDPARVGTGGLVLGPDREVACSVGVSDLAGNALAVPYRWRWTAGRAQDKTPPEAPTLSYVPGKAFCRQTFETTDAPWGDWGGFDVRRTSEVAATGRWALRLQRSGHVRGCQALWDVRQLPMAAYPMLAFNLWLPARQDDPARSYSFDLAKLCFDGHVDGARSVAALDDIAPGSWQFVQVDLRVTRAPGDGEPFGILLRHSRDDSKPAGVQVFLDNVTAYSPEDRNPGFEWSVPFDASGIAGYSWVWNQEPGTVPQPAVRTADTSVRFTGVPAGAWVFHVRAVDGAGNWGRAAHLAIRTE